MLSRRLAGDAAYYSDVDRIVREGQSAALSPQAEFIDDILMNFPIYARRPDLSRFLVRYEMFRRAMEVPGYFVEVGVYRGEGLLTWAKLIDMHAPGDRLRRVIGFDNFAGFPSFHEKDGAEMELGQKVVNGWSPAAAKAELETFIDLFQKDRLLPHTSLIEIVEGDVCETVPAYAEQRPGLRIALLNIDVDLYEPTLAVLKAFYPLVAPGGVVLIDEYGVPDWPGPAAALEEYFEGRLPRLQKMPLFTTPGAFFIKD